MPKAYRLSMTSMAIIMDNYASQLAEQYGSGTVAQIGTRSNLQLDTMPYAALASTKSQAASVGHHMKYNSLSTQPPSEMF